MVRSVDLKLKTRRDVVGRKWLSFECKGTVFECKFG